jgi:hypothetical protein
MVGGFIIRSEGCFSHREKKGKGSSFLSVFDTDKKQPF